MFNDIARVCPADSRSWKWKLAAAVIATLPVRFLAAQTTYTWQNPAGGDFFDPTNWNPNGTPDPNTGQDIAVFSLDSTYTVADTGGTNMNHASFTAGNVTVDTTNGGFFFTNTTGFPEGSSLAVADDPTNSGQTASLTITSSDGNGGGSASIGVGRFSNSTGTLTLDGQGQPLHFFADFYTAVGYTDDNGDAPGNGTMNVINGANFQTSQGYIDGNVHVGNGGTWDNTETDATGEPTMLRVGVTGTGTMLVDGGDNGVTAPSSLLSLDTVIGRDMAANGTINIQGTGSSFTSTTVEVGVQGAALLSVQDQASATLGSVDIGTAYRDAIDSGTVDELNVQSDAVVNVTGTLRVGVVDIGNLNIGNFLNGGSTDGTVNAGNVVIGVNAPGSASVGFGYSIGDSPATPFVGTLNVTNTLTVGQNPDLATGNGETSTLDIEGGGAVTSGYGIVGDTNDPFYGPSSGQVTLNGVLGLFTNAVSEWIVTNDLTIGNLGEGTVSVDQGALLQVGGNIYLGRQSSQDGTVLSAGTLTVSNSNNSSIPTTVTAANLYLSGDSTGPGGIGAIFVQGGQVLISTSAYAYTNSVVHVIGSGFMAVGIDSAGDIPGGFQPNGTLLVGASAAGTLTLDGENSTLLAAELQIGQTAGGFVSVQNNASGNLGNVDIGIGYRNAFVTGTTAELNIQQGASVSVLNSVNVGVNDVGTLNVGGIVQGDTFAFLTNGSLSSSEGVVGVNAPGETDVIGGGASWSVSDTLTVGEGPDITTGQHMESTLNITQEGEVTSAFGIVGDQYNPSNGGLAHGEVWIYGGRSTASSEWHVTNDLTIGNSGWGVVEVNAGALLQVDGNIYLGLKSTSPGMLEVGDFNNTTLAKVSAANMYVGGSAVAVGGGGTVGLYAGNTIDITNTMHIWPGSSLTTAGSLNVGATINDGTLTQTAGNTSAGKVTGAGSTTVSGGQFVAASIQQPSLTITNGLVQIASAPIAPVSNIRSLNISGGDLDLTDSRLMIPYTGTSPLATIRGDIASGYDKGKWDGVGIVSSTAQSNTHHSTSLGIAEASVVLGISGSQIGIWDEQEVTATTVLVMYTWYGDANLDGVVNATDLAMIKSNGTIWSNGDFNYDGVVNADDYALFMLGAASGASNIATTLPEPSLLVASSIGLLAISRRRRAASGGC
jgi:T5SS/PEP-CTERM-associated repeat protein